MSRLIGIVNSDALIKALTDDLFGQFIPKIQLHQNNYFVDFICETDCNIYTIQEFLSKIMKYHVDEKVEDQINLATINTSTYLGLHFVQGYHINKNCTNHKPIEELITEIEDESEYQVKNQTKDKVKTYKSIQYAHKLEESCKVKEWKDLEVFENFYDLEKGPQPPYDELKSMRIIINSKKSMAKSMAKLGLILEIGRLGKADEIKLICLICQDEDKDIKNALAQNNIKIEILSDKYNKDNEDDEDDNVINILKDIIEDSKEEVSEEDLKIDKECWEHHTSGFFTRWLFPYFKKITFEGIIKRIKLLHPTKEKPFVCVIFGDWEWYEHSIIREFSELLEFECKCTTNVNKILHKYGLAATGNWSGTPMFAKFPIEIYESETEGVELNDINYSKDY